MVMNLGNLNIVLSGYAGRVVSFMLKEGYAKTKTEALRLALFEFDRTHKVIPDEETSLELIAEKIISDVKSGKEKTRKFSLKELG